MTAPGTRAVMLVAALDALDRGDYLQARSDLMDMLDATESCDAMGWFAARMLRVVAELRTVMLVARRSVGGDAPPEWGR